MYQQIYTSKYEIAVLPQWPAFVEHVYSTYPESKICEVMDLLDGHPFVEWREVDDETFIDAFTDPKWGTAGAQKVSGEEFILAVAPHLMDQKVKPTDKKRKKGPSRKAPTVNKATIMFMSGETYTVKDFISIEATDEKVVFIMEDNWKETVNYRQAITVPNDDVVEVKVRGVKRQFVLDMSLTNTGNLVWQEDGVEIILSELTVRV